MRRVRATGPPRSSATFLWGEVQSCRVSGDPRGAPHYKTARRAPPRQVIRGMFHPDKEEEAFAPVSFGPAIADFSEELLASRDVLLEHLVLGDLAEEQALCNVRIWGRGQVRSRNCRPPTTLPLQLQPGEFQGLPCLRVVHATCSPP